jgi:ADP-ribosylglycohydrolase
MFEAAPYRTRVRGCLLGGAIGDALGAGIEFDTLEHIHRRFGPSGVTGYVEAYGGVEGSRTTPR